MSLSLRKKVWNWMKAYRFRSKNPKQTALLENFSFDRIENIPPQTVNKIGIVIPEFSPYGGGITSIFRLGSGLAARGFSVVYVTYSDQPERQIEKNANRVFPNHGGEIATWEKGKTIEFDVVIATEYISAYMSLQLTGYKCFFVQDFEPYFSEVGDQYLIAGRVYTMGFHLISLGTWCKDIIHRMISERIPIDTVPFPYEPKEYRCIDRDYDAYAQKKTFRLCVYIRQTPRRLPLFCQVIAGALKDAFARDGKELDVLYYGEEKMYRYEHGKCLGRLSRRELFELYRSCDFGMVASCTNISLVPYEMMATGLPIIEFKAGSFERFFDAEDAFLYDFDCEKLYREIKEAIGSPQILKDRNCRLQEKLKHLHWDDTIDRFADLLRDMPKKSCLSQTELKKDG